MPRDRLIDDTAAGTEPEGNAVAPEEPCPGCHDRRHLLHLLQVLVDPPRSSLLVQRIQTILESWTGCDVTLAWQEDSPSGVFDPPLESHVAADALDISLDRRPAGADVREDSSAVIPLAWREQAVGVIRLRRRSPERWPPRQQDLLHAAASAISAAVVQRRRLSSFEGRLRQIAELLSEVAPGQPAPATPIARDLAPQFWSLSPREIEVLRLLACNRRPAAIARRLDRSIHTVRNQLKAIYRKVGVHSQDELLTLLETTSGLVGPGRPRGPVPAAGNTVQGSPAEPEGLQSTEW